MHGLPGHKGHTIRVISLNIQHGWNHGHTVPPVYLQEKKVFENLDKIVDLIKEYEADVVLLQEVDQTSPLTRRIDQLAYIQKKTGLPHSAFGASSELKGPKKMLYSAGCGIISRYKMTEVENIKFELSFPTPRKGFLSATLSIAPGVELTVVSVHMVMLDILKRFSRKSQIERMADALKHKKAVVIGGDLNISLKNKHMSHFMQKLNVTTHIMTDDKHLRTHPAIKPARRIDWIFASPHLTMTDYRAFPHRVSDHLAVGSTIAI